MYLPPISEVFQAHPRSMIGGSIHPLARTNFILDSSGVAGVLGGEEAIASITLVHVFEGRKWLGWYNSPGSYVIGMRFGRLARSAVPASSLHGRGGVRTDLATLFEYDGRKGPRFRAVHSGTALDETGHLAALLMCECVELEGEKVKGRETRPIGVTIADLSSFTEKETYSLKWSQPLAPLYASVPILISLLTCAASGWYRDWYSFSMILLGIIASGVSSHVIGSGNFTFTHPEPALGSPPGDGILSSEDGVVLLSGSESAINAVTRGRFSLTFESRHASRSIRWCSVFLVTQAIAQLIVIPQGSLFGQLMFVSSVAVSWAYNLWLGSFDKEKVHRDILMDILGKPKLTKFILGTRTSMVVFVLLVLHLRDPEEIMNVLLPHHTPVWLTWKTTIIDRLKHRRELEFGPHDWDDPAFSSSDRDLLRTLFKDAEDAYRGFKSHYDNPKA
ncbi:hypothetical protein V8B97DRAFT_1921936 [Scleroderma yunnanense]